MTAATAQVDLAAMLETGITYRQLDYWCRTGYLHPSTANPGSGYQRSFPADEVEIARLMVLLTGAGVEAKAAARAAREGVETGMSCGQLDDGVVVAWFVEDPPADLSHAPMKPRTQI